MFLLEAAKQYKQIGAIAPFSEVTIEKVLSIIKIKHNPNEKLNVIEMGPGEGGFTRRLCETFTHSTIHAFEINELFVQELNDLEYPNLIVHHLSAEFVDDHVQDADIIVSTLPFSIFDSQLTKLILESAQNSLKKGGLLIIVQYSNFSVDEINAILESKPIYSDRSFRNIPPAKIFVYRK